MSKHTPGPWNYGEGYIDTHAVDDDGSCDYIILAELHSTFGPDNYGVDQWMLPPEEYDANGRLMAAAPEMYELLRDVRQYVADANLRSDCYAEIDLKAIDALLAKIEGGGE